MLSGWKQKKGGHRSANGFSLVPALLCLMFTAAVCAACTARMDAWIWLKRAQDRSVWELSVIDQAKAFWHEGQTMKLCDRKQPESLRQVQIQEDTVALGYSHTVYRKIRDDGSVHGFYRNICSPLGLNTEEPDWH